MSVIYLLMAGGAVTGAPGSSGIAIVSPANINITQSGSPISEGVLSVKLDGNISSSGNADVAWMAPYHEIKVQDYEVRLTLTTGVPPSSGGALSTWYALTSGVSWGWLLSAPQTSKSFTGSLEIRRIIQPLDTVTTAVSVSLTQG